MKEKVQAHLRNAHQRLEDAEGLFPIARYSGTVSRTYYAMFEAASAILANLGMEFDSHQAVISKFGEAMVKTGRIEPKFGRYLSRGFRLREDADYALDARGDIPRHAAEAELGKAREFVKMAEDFLLSQNP